MWTVYYITNITFRPKRIVGILFGFETMKVFAKLLNLNWLICNG